MTFEAVFKNARYVLTEGAVAERLKTEFSLDLDDHINHAGLIYDAPRVMGTLYRQYIEIAQQYHTPIMLMTPTRKVNIETTRQSGYPGKNIISDCCTFLRKIKKAYPQFSDHIFIGGLLGCKGNAYSGDDALSERESYWFHRTQVQQFAGKQMDFLFAGIMPAVSEAMGMANAMAEYNMPYIISFMVGKNGKLLDGTWIADAVEMIDQKVRPIPLCYMANCVHPGNLFNALTCHDRKRVTPLERFMGIQANASSLGPEVLDQCGTLHQENFEKMVQYMDDLRKIFGFKVFGGCCGTNDIFFDRLCRMLHKDD